MRISDWSSDVCSSDLQYLGDVDRRRIERFDQKRHPAGKRFALLLLPLVSRLVDPGLDRRRALADGQHLARQPLRGVPRRLDRALRHLAQFAHLLPDLGPDRFADSLSAGTPAPRRAFGATGATPLAALLPPLVCGS